MGEEPKLLKEAKPEAAMKEAYEKSTLLGNAISSWLTQKSPVNCVIIQILKNLRCDSSILSKNQQVYGYR